MQELEAYSRLRQTCCTWHNALWLQRKPHTRRDMQISLSSHCILRTAQVGSRVCICRTCNDQIKLSFVHNDIRHTMQCVCLSNSLLDFPLYNACTMRTTIHNGERLHLFSFGIAFEFIWLPSCSILVFLRSFATTTGAHNNSRKKERESYQDGEPEGY